MIKKAMILAAGFGKRIHPLTLNCPKPLLKINEETLLSNTLKFLELLGIKEVVINVHYLKEQIIDYISKKNLNLKINIIQEKEKILDTGGGVLNTYLMSRISHYSKSKIFIPSDKIIKFKGNTINESENKNSTKIDNKKIKIIDFNKLNEREKNFKNKVGIEKIKVVYFD